MTIYDNLTVIVDDIIEHCRYLHIFLVGVVYCKNTCAKREHGA